eukprot:TRINITY_DN79091_c0_g1_i1.p1 TRINITY_DN79091_c0_g1~~TRINITY_DN79091_c0_g1_i1.p1  ORF type:complete len:231 (+),score=57.33 TRINITY_DN79091_c0_g1_i1:38-694(+)
MLPITLVACLTLPLGWAANENPAAVPELDESTFDPFIAEHPVVLVKFYKDWCGYCQRLKPHYHNASLKLAELKSSVRLASVSNGDVQKRFEVKKYPTLLLFVDGKATHNYWAFDYDDVFDLMHTFDTSIMPVGFVQRKYYWLRSLYKFGTKALLRTFKFSQSHVAYDIFPHTLPLIIVWSIVSLCLLLRSCISCCCGGSTKKASKDETKARQKTKKVN